jgi:ABC-2 type transport system permease protein
MSLYLKLVSASIRSQMEYKFSFITSVLIFAVLSAMDFILVAAILLKFDHIQGWALYEVGYLYAVSSMVSSIYRIFANEVHNFEKYTLHGELDQLLTRPVSPLLILFTRNLHLTQLGGFLQGSVILFLSLGAMWKNGYDILPAVFYLPVALLFGTVILFSIGLVTATMAFWITRISELQVFTMYAPLTASSFPIQIYPGWLKGLLLTLLPVAFMAYVPSLYLFNKGGSLLYLFVSPIVALVAITLALRFWKWGIKHYHSTGS